MPANRFSIYDALDKKGYFDSNPANSFARDKVTGASLFQGPVEYPKMMYHPEGEEKIIAPGEVVTNALGAMRVGEQREMLYQIVEGPAEEKVLRAEGWHDHPARAIRARVEKQIASNPEISEKDKAKLLKSIPQISSDTRIRELEAEIAKLTADRASEQRTVDTDPGTNRSQPPPTVTKSAPWSSAEL